MVHPVVANLKRLGGVAACAVVLFGVSSVGLPLAGAAESADGGWSARSVSPIGRQVVGDVVAPLRPLDELLPETASLHRDVLAFAPFDSQRVRSLQLSLSLEFDKRDAAEERIAVLDGELAGLKAHQESLASSVRAWQAERRRRRATEAAVVERLREFAVASFTAGGDESLIGATLGRNADHRDGIEAAVEADIEQDIADARAAVAEADAVLAQLKAQQVALRVTEEATNRRRELAVQTKAAAEVNIAGQQPQLAGATVLAPIDGVDFPAIALDAYYRAAETMRQQRPGCDLAWYQLAGIGRVETHHGTYGGSSIVATGEVQPHILGVVLDGTRFSAIADTDGGQLDGNTTWDRAVGPMQFIPSSWKIFGKDGDGDGVADPHNLYDAALAAAEHLCRGHSGLGTTENYRQALLGYNRSKAYGTEVIGYSRRYRDAVALGPRLLLEDDTTAGTDSDEPAAAESD